MRKASKIVLIIAGVLSIVFILSLFLTGFIMVAYATAPGSPFAELFNAFEQIIKEIDPTLDAEAVAALAMSAYIASIIASLCWSGLLSFITAILCFVGASANKKGVYIAIIVFFALGGGQIVALLGAIFGLVARKQEANAVVAQQ